MTRGYKSEGDIIDYKASGNIWAGDAVCAVGARRVMQSTAARVASGVGVAFKNAGELSGIAIVRRGYVTVRSTGTVNEADDVMPDASGTVRRATKLNAASGVIAVGLFLENDMRGVIGRSVTSGTNKEIDIIVNV